MSHKGQTTTLEERVTIAERVDAGQSSREIAEELGRPLPTIRKWRQRYLRKGRAGLSSRMGRPAAGALATAPAEMKDAILELREAHPGWGAQTLRTCGFDSHLRHYTSLQGYKKRETDGLAFFASNQPIPPASSKANSIRPA